MKSLLDKLTFRLLIGQLLPGAALILTGRVALDFASRAGDAGWKEIGVREVLSGYLAVLDSLSGVGDWVVLATWAAVVGLALQTTTNLMTANRESFRTSKLDSDNQWVKKEAGEIRGRSLCRRWVARLWFERGLWLILPLAPLLLLFDFFTVLAARPRDLYKEIYLVRTEAEKMEKLEGVISDYEYQADYFGNMALALTGHLAVVTVLLDFPGSQGTSIWYCLGVYGLVSLHYFSFRFVRTSVDQALDLAFARDAVKAETD